MIINLVSERIVFGIFVVISVCDFRKWDDMNQII